MPNLRHEMMGPQANGRMHYVMRWKVPIDDYSHIGFKVDFIPVTGEERERLADAMSDAFNNGCFKGVSCREGGIHDFPVQSSENK